MDHCHPERSKAQAERSRRICGFANRNHPRRASHKRLAEEILWQIPPGVRRNLQLPSLFPNLEPTYNKNFFSLDSTDFTQKRPPKVFNPDTLSLKCLTIKPLKPAAERLRPPSRRIRIPTPSPRQAPQPLGLFVMMPAVAAPLHRDPATRRSIRFVVLTKLDVSHTPFFKPLLCPPSRVPQVWRFSRPGTISLQAGTPLEPFLLGWETNDIEASGANALALHLPLNDIALSTGESVTPTTIGALRKYMSQSAMAGFCFDTAVSKRPHAGHL